MWRALVWKEWRTLRLILLALAVFGTMSIAVASVWRETDKHAGSWVLLAVLAALVCGAAAIAEEREKKTLPLLQRLPVHPFRVFVAKAVFGLGATLAVLGVLLGVGVATGAVGPHDVGMTVAVVVSMSLVAWAAGALAGSAASQSLTAAVGGGAIVVAVEMFLSPFASAPHYKVLWTPLAVFSGMPTVVVLRVIAALVLAAGAYAVYCGPVERRRLMWWGR